MSGVADIRLDYSRDDQAWDAVLMRDGQPWYLNGALVGMGHKPGEAVNELFGLMEYLVIHGGNFLTDTVLSLEDRVWLYLIMENRLTYEKDSDMYTALRNAGWDR